MKKLISIVLPCHNEAENIPLLIPKIIKNIPKKYAYEIICVDDGSSDQTFDIIKNIASKNKKIKGIGFYRQFGHQSALIAGIKKTNGDAVVTMDSDFQHPPEMFPKMTSFWEKGHDLIVLKRSRDSYSSIFDNIQRQIGYAIWSWVSGGILIPGASDFRLMDKGIVKYLKKSNEHELFIRGLVNMAAKNIAILTYKLGKRKYGKSSYNFSDIRNLFLNGLISFSVIPLRIATYGGFILGFLSALFLIADVIQALIVGRRIISGYLTIVFLMMILNGFIIFYLGILGEYLGVIFKEVKKRPKYIISDTVNIK